LDTDFQNKLQDQTPVDNPERVVRRSLDLACLTKYLLIFVS
jgi:hypothetical protein